MTTSSFEPGEAAVNPRSAFRPVEAAAQSGGGGFVVTDHRGVPIAGRNASGGAQGDGWPDRAELADEAWAAGVAHGRAQLPWQDAEALQRATVALEAAAGQVAHLRRDYLRAHRRALVDLALSLSEKLVRAHVQRDPDALAAMIAAALDALGEEEPLRLLLSEADCGLLNAGRAPRVAELLRDRSVAVESDGSLAAGDVRVLAPGGQVDARVDELLRRLGEELGGLVEIEEVCE